MADSKVQRQAEKWVREEWLPGKYHQPFSKGKLDLSSGGVFEFDGISADRKIAVAISTNRGITTGGKKPSAKLHKLRADVLFLLLASVRRRVIVLTDEQMLSILLREKTNGRLPLEIEIEHAPLPTELQNALLDAQFAASDEMASVRPVSRQRA